MRSKWMCARGLCFWVLLFCVGESEKIYDIIFSSCSLETDVFLHALRLRIQYDYCFFFGSSLLRCQHNGIFFLFILRWLLGSNRAPTNGQASFWQASLLFMQNKSLHFNKRHFESFHAARECSKNSPMSMHGNCCHFFACSWRISHLLKWSHGNIVSCIKVPFCCCSFALSALAEIHWEILFASFFRRAVFSAIHMKRLHFFPFNNFYHYLFVCCSLHLHFLLFDAYSTCQFCLVFIWIHKIKFVHKSAKIFFFSQINKSKKR